MTVLDYGARADRCSHPLSQQLFHLMAEKQTNLAVAADLTVKQQVLDLADQIGPEICLFKTHVDIIADFDEDFTQQLQALAEQHNFLIFEDRKFADIGNTVALQYGAGIYHIADWAHITNAHIVPGPGIIAGLKKIGQPKGNGLLLLAQMSSTGTMAKGDYTKTTVALAEEYQDFVIGFICQQRLTDQPQFIHMTPGVKLAAGGDDLGQQYITPHKAIVEQGNDIIIVGRGIYHADSPLTEAKRYRKAGWDAYQQQLLA